MSASLLQTSLPATVTVHSHRWRAVRLRGVAAAAASASASSSSDDGAEAFTAPMLQNVRQKVKGFETTMAVSKLPTDEDVEDERKPMAGDLVSIVFSAQTEEGELLQSMEDMEEPITFEVGAADSMGNPLFLAFDKAVQGMVVGDQALVSASGGDYDPNLLFKVRPPAHPKTRLLAVCVSGGTRNRHLNTPSS